MEKIKNVKSIQIKGELEGRGIVNFDSDKQLNIIKFSNLMEDMGIKNDDDYAKIGKNIKLGKKSFKYEGKKTIANKDGDKTDINIYSYKNLISSACLRHATYQNDVEMVNSSIMLNEIILSNYVTSFVGLTRGYLFAQTAGKNLPTIKRTSCLTLTDAIESNNAKSVMSIGTTMGVRDNKSMTYNETVGDIEYDFSGSINPKTLQFISTDLFFDRLAMFPDWLKNGMFDNCMMKHYGDKAQYKTGHFTHQAQYLTKTICENGVLLNNDFTVYLIKETLKRLLRINIIRSTAYAKIKELKIRLVDDILMDEEEGWITLNSDADIDNLDFSVFEYFEETTDEDFNERKIIEEEYKKISEENKKEQDAKSKSKKAKKSKQDNEETADKEELTD